MKLHLERLEGARKTLVIVGILLLAVSSALFLSSLIGVFSMESLAIGGQSGLRTIAGVAILGCLLAAIGYWDQ